MTLKEQLQADVAVAMRAGDTERRDTVRMLLAAVKQEEVDRRVELDDAGILAVLSKQAKQRRESIADAEKAGRPDLAAQEQIELVIIEHYLPQMMTAEEIGRLAREVIDSLNAGGMKDMGRVMGQLIPKIQGRADGRLVSDVVRQLLQN
jgi:uncharacterized protein